MNKTNIEHFKDYIRIKRAHEKLNKAYELANWPTSDSFYYITDWYKQKIGPEFDSMKLMYEKIKESL